MVGTTKKQCPVCNVTLTRFERSRLWWVSSGMSGRLVHPCPACGSLLHLSSMRLLTTLGALGLIGTSIARIGNESLGLLLLALVFAVCILVGMVSTRVEAIRQLTEVPAKR